MMETWAIVTLVLGTSALSSLLTFFITKMQVRHSDKRLEKELERAREADYRQRRWEVRSESLLKLRAELALMATKLQKLIINTKNQSVLINKKETQQVFEDWNNYMTSGEFLPTLYLQYDEEFKKQFEGIEGDYLLLFEYALGYKNLKREELSTFREISQSIKNKILDAQELINKRLEEL